VAAAANIEAVIVSGHVDPWSPVVIRSGTGLQYAINVGLAELPFESNRPIVAVDTDGEPFQSSKLDVDSILAVGGERYGLSPTLKEMAEQTISIPMRPGVSSLNLSTAVSALLFSWRASVMECSGSYPW
jgi:TrmH family RNA methyltransferase